MALVEFSTQLEAANSVLNLAQRLGERCLQSRTELAQMSDRKRTKEELDLIEELAARSSYDTWAEAVREPGKAEEQLGADLAAAVKRAKMRHPLDFLGVLRGLCRGPLQEFFATTADQVELTKGLPIPFATRPLPDKLVGDSTTPQTTLKDGGLLFPLPYDIYTHLPAEEHRVVLDFSHGDRLDALTWNEEEKLPWIATLHPIGGGNYEIEDEDEDHGRFFGVRPASWDIEAVKNLLERARAAGARLAVLPELSLPDPQALEAEMARNPGSYPQIVVAGSAHRESAAANGGATIRANESRVYLDGECVAVAQKHHAFKTKILSAKKFDKPQREDLTREQKTILVLSGRRTRLAVAICADLLETEIPRLLVDAGVNLLLAPAMTPKIGSFNPSLTGIAGHCQGVAAIANTRWADDGMPFLCMCAVPRPDPSQQSAALRGDGDNPAPDLAILDPNEPLPEAVSWPGRDVDSG
jgi:hypothetical protein